MEYYEKRIDKDLLQWEKELLKKPPLYTKAAKEIQTKINNKIPQRVHDTIATSVKVMIKTVITGSDWIDRQKPNQFTSLIESDMLADAKAKQYRKTATIEGIATGAGGFLMGAADFPLLLSIKIKFLYDVAGCYGFNIKNLDERVFILYIFQLVFSDYSSKKKVFPIIKDWEAVHRRKVLDHPEDFDWLTFQQDYRDYIDLAKLLQLIPGFGAVIGGYANNQFLKELGETAKNCYRIRLASST